MRQEFPVHDFPVRYAGFWRRFAAALIDSFIMTAVFSLVLGPAVMNAELFSLEGLLRTVIGMLVTVLLWVWFLGTPGKLLLDCQVVDADTFKPLTPRQGLLRYVAYLASLLPLGLGFLWIAIDPRKQGFHDKIARTVVVYKAGIEADDESVKSLNQLVSEVR